MSDRCTILAYLTLDAREPTRSGRRLIEWAAVCNADGIIVPWLQQAEPGAIDRLVDAARAAKLSCHVELQPGMPAPAPPGINGYYIATPDDWSVGALQGFGHAMICVKDAKQLEPYVSSLPQASFVFTDCGHPSGAWFAIWQVLSRAGRRRALGFLDENPGFWRAIERTASAPFVVKRLTLNRSLVGPADGGALIPYELSILVQVARGIREQLAVVTGRQPANPEPDVGEGRVMPDSGVADIAIVIRSKNEAEWLGRTLAQITRQSRQPKEVVLVDNESTDETVSIARRFEQQLPMKIVAIRDSEFNFSRALNLGIEQTTASWVVSLSAHCIPASTEWLAAFEQETLREEWSGKKRKLLAGVYGRQEPMEGLTSDVDKRDLWTTFGAEQRVQHGQDFFFHNANSMIRRDIWQKEFRFDESINGVEDRDWAQKVLRDGYVILYTPKASVSHYHGIHHGRNEARAKRVVKVIELIHQRTPLESPSR